MVIKAKKQMKNLLLVIVGVFIEAVAVSIFVLPNNILTGGISGVAVALQPVIPIHPVWMMNGIIIALYLIGFLMLGKQFALKSLVATITFSISITVLSLVLGCLPDDFFVMPDYLASIYAGVFMGVGLGLVFRVNASTGGMDILALLLNKYLKIKSGDAVMIIDGLTVALGIFTYGLVPALIGIISVFICGETINRTVMLNSESAKEVLIISECWKELNDYLLEKVDRGVTLVDGYGGYTNQSKKMIMCVIKQKEYPQIETNIMAIDSLAFIVVSDVNQVHGEGFTFLQENRIERMRKYETNA